MRTILGGAILACLSICAVPAAAARLTGVGIFGSNSSGDLDLIYWNTKGSDVAFNLYLKQGATWINSGNGSGASIDIPLSLGTYTYAIYGQNVVVNEGHVGINLFFDGNNGTPLISGLLSTNTYSATGANLVANSSSLTPALSAILPVAGANTLQFTQTGLIYKLSAISWYTPNTAPLAGDTQSAAVGNYVAAFSNSPDFLSAKDYRGYFTLMVVPEPSTWVSMAAGLGMLVVAVRRRRK